MFFKIKKGLTLPINGRPDARIDDSGEVKSVAVLGGDYVGLKPTMLVQAGDLVQIGTPLFEDKKNPGVIITSPANGVVTDINRGDKRALLSVVVDVQGDDAIDYSDGKDLLESGGANVISVLQKSGLWTSFRTRPYGKVPAIDNKPNSIFINAMDTNPLAIDPALIINEQADDYINGVAVIAKLGVPVHVCQHRQATMPTLNKPEVSTALFDGPHPAGLSSTHVHFVDPVNSEKTVWTIGYQDVIAIGQLFATGKLNNDRYIALAGPKVNSPRVLRTKQGANLTDFIQGRTVEGDKRVISGSIFNGHEADGALDFLGRYDNQVSVIEENEDREFLGWIMPGASKFSALNVFISSLFKPKQFNFTTSQNGSPRAIVPVGVFERVMPLDILPTPLVKALLVKDTDSAQELGCLELVEEDMALLSFVDPGKHDFGPVLRSTLTQIEVEG